MIKKVVLEKADRLYHFPFDLEEFYPRRTLKSTEKRVPTIDLGHFVWPVTTLQEIASGKTLEMADTADLLKLKETIADWLRREYDIRIDARNEIYIGQGIHRIIFDIFLAYVEYGDIVLCPEPGMPSYKRLAIAVGGVPVTYPISVHSGCKPSFVKLTSNLGKAAKILTLNNPNNPFGTVLDDTELAELVRIASKQNMFVINDAAYCSLTEEKFRPLASIPGGDKVGMEIFSFPLTFGLPHLPFGFAVGTPETVAGLAVIRQTLTPAFPKAWVEAAIGAIESYPSAELKAVRKLITQSRLEALRLVEKMGWEPIGDRSVPFLWIKIPKRKQASTYAAALLRRKRILTLPGTAFGETGEGHIRLSLTAAPESYKEAYQRLSRKMTIRSISGE